MQCASAREQRLRAARESRRSSDMLPLFKAGPSFEMTQALDEPGDGTGDLSQELETEVKRHSPAFGAEVGHKNLSVCWPSDTLNGAPGFHVDGS